MATLYRVAIVCFAVLFVLILASACASASGGRILFSTTWDDDYLYTGFVVDDPDVVGVSKAPNSSDLKDDDAVGLFFDTKPGSAKAPSANTIKMAVSAAGGSSFSSGKDGSWQPRAIFTYKYGATVQGTINNSEDMDRSFSVEVALPWSELGGKPAVGQIIGFNLVRLMQGDHKSFVSMSQGVTSLDAADNPGNWIEMSLAGPGSAQDSTNTGKIICPKAGVDSPLIDGLLKAKEWKGASLIQIDQPQLAEQTETPAAEAAETHERIDSKSHAYPNETLVFARYYYSYQFGAEGSAPVLTDQPIRGIGPWMSYARAQWHKDELEGMRKAGIDVALPVYHGDSQSRKAYADQGLDCMVEALMELKAEGKEYPLVALSLDASALSTAYAGAKPDLKDEEAQRTLYGMISNFISRVPEEFLAVTQLDKSRGRAAAYVVFLSGSESLDDFDSSFMEYCDRRFAQDFGGARLAWIGDPGFKQKAPDMDGYVGLGAGLGLKFDDSGWLDVAAVGPGFAVINGKSRSRQDGKTYQNDWTELIAKKPDWVVVDSWNGLHEGSEICPTRQYGITYTELSAVEAIRYRGMREWDAAFLRHNVPEVIIPQSIHLAEITVKNVGTVPWRVGEGYSLTYRWFKNDKLFDEGIVRVPLLRNVLPGRSANLTIGLIAQDKNSQPIPPGKYELHFEMMQGKDKWFADQGDVPLVVPVRVGLPTGPKAQFLSSTLPALMKSGASYPFKVRIRNDGANPWKGGEATEVLCKMYKVSSYTHDAPEELSEPVDLKPVKMIIPTAIEPGRVAELSATLSLVDSSGKPIPVWKPGDLWTYKLRWVLWADRRWLGESDGSPWHQTVEVLDNDCGARFVSCQTPKEMLPGKTVTIPATVKNTGPEPIKGAKVSYHWYKLDGSVAARGGVRTSLKTLNPGEVAVVQAKVQAPDTEGEYNLVWDVAQGETWVSTLSNSRGADTIVATVKVGKGKGK